MTIPQDHTTQLIAHLSANSTPYVDPLTRVPWERMERRGFWLPQHAISLYGWAEFMNLPEDQRRMLSRYEFLRMAEVAVAFEGMHLERVARGLQHNSSVMAGYRLHMTRENAGYALVLAELRRRANLQPVNTALSGVLLRTTGRYAPVDSLPYWLTAFTGEEVFSRWFRFVRKHHSDLCPTVGEIARTRLVDSARHLSHAHEMLEAQLRDRVAWRLRLWQPYINSIFSSIARQFFYPSRTVYELAGLYPGEYWVKVARNNPHRAKFIQSTLHSTLRPLKKRGLHIADI